MNICGRRFKSTVTYSIFGTTEVSAVEELSPGVPMSFDVELRGALLQGGIEDMVQRVSSSAPKGYTSTTATGGYAGASAGR